ncbi:MULTISPECIES: cupin domain-containing protein [unclassified Bacillus (in: firmicutes)]|uniref:cupin domain-containing protein n=1 Tax=unclassified Bacillus (in: firmicutes) TaxID=185979 RepID=UPI0008E3F93B|nr:MULTISPECIES: cupin domain-containing protein [unclassified Bacillus (in: firmicutes)]SFA70470.1 Mannose-6-phosphate isomerase, cupin superfamily [Bacillus sp. UNCCL13]SFQ60294.1 Mannose-6-phosphate isomerase, cupin superfamily [Bacillus sp. cl95]
MYYVPKTYSYPYYANVNSSMYYSNNMVRNHQENYHTVFEAILRGIKREASAIELYRQLAEVAPNQKHKSDILQALEGKKTHLTQFTNLYVNLTGTQPVYQNDQISFRNYRDGLQKAYRAEVEGYEEYQKSCLLTQHPLVQNVFLWAISDEQENAARFSFLNEELSIRVTDYGPKPFVVDIEEVTKQNNTFRTAIWTGSHLQVTLMSINVGEDIGLEIHPTLDQFLRIEEGQGIVQMGDSKDKLDFNEKVFDDYAIVIPAGKWHNLINTGNKPIKLYSIYAPPQHPYGTVHETKAIAMAAEKD